MEASAIHASAVRHRFPLGSGLLRLRSDEQLVAAFRAGNDDAFGVLHDRYRQRLFAYVRQMLSSCSRQDAEDVLQDVFVRAYGALRGDNREMNVRAWLYRVAHNRCIDHLRRPVPPPSEIFEVSRKPLHDPVEEAQRRDDLRRLVADVGQLPEQQRSALLMREIDGMTYADLADALDVTVPAVKSLLVRARVGLVEAAEAREADCSEIQADLLRSYDKGVKASGRARKHMRTCENCREYRGALRGMRRSFAALTPLGAGPLAFAAKLVGLGGSAAAGGGGAVVAGGSAATACKVAAVVCTAAIATGGAVEVKKEIVHRTPAKTEHVAKHKTAAKPAPAPISTPIHTAPQVSTLAPAPPAAASSSAAPAKKADKKKPAKRKIKAVVPPVVPIADEDPAAAPVVPDPQAETGGAIAPAVPTATPTPAPADPAVPTPTPTVPAPTPEAPVPTPGAGGTEAPAPVETAPPSAPITP